MKCKKIISVFICVLMLFNVVSASAAVVDESISSESGDIYVETYEELKSYMNNITSNSRLVLANDIIVSDNKNDNELVVRGWSFCNLELNGYTLSRTTRGIDNCLIQVDTGGSLVITDSSANKTGTCQYVAGNGSGTNSVIFSDGDVRINSGNFNITTPYSVGSGVVILAEQGDVDIYNGVFDSSKAFGGDTIELRHNAPVYDVPHCNIYGGKFYGKISNFDVSTYSDFSKYGTLYPTVYVMGGEFYIANPDDEYAGFAYCNNGWGKVIVAKGNVFYKCLNSSDQRFLPNVYKSLKQVDYNDKTGAYYSVTEPPMIYSLGLDVNERLYYMCAKSDLSSYNKNGTIYKTNVDYIEDVLNKVDTIEVSATDNSAPYLWVGNYLTTDTVRWYFSDEEHYAGKDTIWSELADYRNQFLPWKFDTRPTEDTTVYVRTEITRKDGTVAEDVVAIHYNAIPVENKIIDNVDIYDIDTPYAGNTPDMTASARDKGYYVEKVEWYDDTEVRGTVVNSTDKFISGHTYRVAVTVRTSDGYTFIMDDVYNDATGTINGNKAVAYGSHEDDFLEIGYTFSPCEGDYSGFLLGDADSDGSITIKDATLVQSWIAKFVKDTDLDLSASDVDEDGSVTIKDATTIQMIVAKLI